MAPQGAPPVGVSPSESCGEAPDERTAPRPVLGSHFRVSGEPHELGRHLLGNRTRPWRVAVLVKARDVFDWVDRCRDWPGDDLDLPGARGLEELLLPLDQDRKRVNRRSLVRGRDVQAVKIPCGLAKFCATQAAIGRKTLDAAQPEQPLANLVVAELKRLAGNRVGDLSLEGAHPIRGAELAVDLKEAPVEGRTEHMVLQPRLHTKPNLRKSAAMRIVIASLPNPLRHVAVVCDRNPSAPGRE